MERNAKRALGEVDKQGVKMILKLLIVGVVVGVVISWWLWRGIVKLNNKVKAWLKGLK